MGFITSHGQLQSRPEQRALGRTDGCSLPQSTFFPSERQGSSECSWCAHSTGTASWGVPHLADASQISGVHTESPNVWQGSCLSRTSLAQGTSGYEVLPWLDAVCVLMHFYKGTIPHFSALSSFCFIASLVIYEDMATKGQKCS